MHSGTTNHRRSQKSDASSSIALQQNNSKLRSDSRLYLSEQHSGVFATSQNWSRECQNSGERCNE